MYTCIDSFSGAGGLGLGLQKAGFSLSLSFDSDSKCVETQRLNPKYFQHKVVLSDVRQMLDGDLKKIAHLKRGELFLLAGGPPCQGFSIQRIGNDEDRRNSLILDFTSLIIEVYPQYFLIENVTGISGKRGGELLQQVTDKLSETGYYVQKTVLDAQDYDVPQRRKRIFIVGERKDLGTPQFCFPAPITPEGKRVTVRQAIGNLPATPSNGSEHPDIVHHKADRLSSLNKRRLLALKQGQGRDSLPEELLANCHKVSSSVIGHRNVYGRMSWDKVAPTITARFDSFTRGLFGHPEQTRTISLREGALLQSFPRDFSFAGTKVEIARQIGNAVPPKVAESIGAQIIKCHLKKTKETIYNEL